MKDLFCIEFDFLGIPVKIFVCNWTDRDEVYKRFETYPNKGSAMFGVSNDENGKIISFILYNDNVNTNLYKRIPTYIHELLHATKFYLYYLTSIKDDEELECYFMGHLVQMYTDLLNQYEKNTTYEKNTISDFRM
ncbi:MAG: hypothetical protein FWC41_02280 [Firmicutes bacterium]|nr:hypothetical protein [Bacillota bacterium]